MQHHHLLPALQPANPLSIALPSSPAPADIQASTSGITFLARSLPTRRRNPLHISCIAPQGRNLAPMQRGKGGNVTSLLPPAT